MTEQVYMSRPTQETDSWRLVESVADAIDEFFDLRLEPLLGHADLLRAPAVTKPVSLDRAAVILGCDADGVQERVAAGLLGAVAAREKNQVRQARLVFEEAEVHALATREAHDASTSYTAAEVTALLRIDHSTLYAWERDGRVKALSATRSRVCRAGVLLPGGGRRFDAESIDALVAQNAERFDRVDRSLTIAEAAATLGVSVDTVRRLVDRGEADGGIDGWRDEASYRRERFVDIGSLDRYRIVVGTMTLQEAAVRLELNVAGVTALIKTGRLTRVQRHQPPGRQRSVFVREVEALSGRAAA